MPNSAFNKRVFPKYYALCLYVHLHTIATCGCSFNLSTDGNGSCVRGSPNSYGIIEGEFPFQRVSYLFIVWDKRLVDNLLIGRMDGIESPCTGRFKIGFTIRSDMVKVHCSLVGDVNQSIPIEVLHIDFHFVALDTVSVRCADTYRAETGTNINSDVVVQAFAFRKSANTLYVDGVAKTALCGLSIKVWSVPNAGGILKNLIRKPIAVNICKSHFPIAFVNA